MNYAVPRRIMALDGACSQSTQVHGWLDSMHGGRGNAAQRGAERRGASLLVTKEGGGEWRRGRGG